MIFLVMQRQYVGAKIRIEIPPHRVNVIGVVLNVVVLHQKRRTLNAVVVWSTFFELPRPGEVDGPQTCGANSIQSGGRDVRGVSRSIFTEERQENLLLLLTQLAGLKP